MPFAPISDSMTIVTSGPPPSLNAGVLRAIAITKVYIPQDRSVQMAHADDGLSDRPRRVDPLAGIGRPLNERSALWFGASFLDT
jgi:hypothetical protein